MTYQGNIRERLDPDHFLALRDADFQAIRSSVFPIKKLRSLSTLVTKGETPLWRGDSFLNEGIPFLRGKNIKGEIDFDDIVYISKDVHERMKRSVLNDDFLLLTIAGTLGDVAFFKKEYPECNINQDIAKIKLTDEISYEYAIVYFQTRFANRQINILSNGATRGHLNFSQVGSFDVIVPPLDIQNHIVEIIQSAYAQKKQKEQEADAVLDSIDRYVLTELGIQVPAVEEKKCFAVYTRRIVGRLDPKYNQPKFEVYKEPKSHFALKKIKELSIDIRTGLPIRQDFRSKDGKYPYYGANGIIGSMDDYTHDGRYLVVGQDGYIGNHYVVEGKFWASNHNWVAMFREDVNLEYVKAFLDAWNYEYLITGGVIPKLTKEAFESISIPIPPFEIQEKIAGEAVRRRSEAAKNSGKKPQRSGKPRRRNLRNSF